MFDIVRYNYKATLCPRDGRRISRAIESMLTAHFEVVAYKQVGHNAHERIVTRLYEEGSMYTGLAVMVKKYLRYFSVLNRTMSPGKDWG